MSLSRLFTSVKSELEHVLSGDKLPTSQPETDLELGLVSSESKLDKAAKYASYNSYRFYQSKQQSASAYLDSDALFDRCLEKILVEEIDRFADNFTPIPNDLLRYIEKITTYNDMYGKPLRPRPSQEDNYNTHTLTSSQKECIFSKLQALKNEHGKPLLAPNELLDDFHDIVKNLQCTTSSRLQDMLQWLDQNGLLVKKYENVIITLLSNHFNRSQMWISRTMLDKLPLKNHRKNAQQFLELCQKGHSSFLRIGLNNLNDLDILNQKNFEQLCLHIQNNQLTTRLCDLYLKYAKYVNTPFLAKNDVQSAYEVCIKDTSAIGCSIM